LPSSRDTVVIIPWVSPTPGDGGSPRALESLPSL
jgi:hypothetical protein